MELWALEILPLLLLSLKSFFQSEQFVFSIFLVVGIIVLVFLVFLDWFSLIEVLLR